MAELYKYQTLAARRSRFPLIVGVAFFAIYAFLSPNASSDKDASEFTLVLATFGTAHPTGYPIYTVVGSIAVRILHEIGFGWPKAACLWSAVGASTAVILLFTLICGSLARREKSAPNWLLSIPAVLFGLNPAWTAEACLPEVNSWHLAWVSYATLMLHRILRAAAMKADPDRPALHGFHWGFICGLGAAHHVTSVWCSIPYTVAIAAAMLRRDRIKASVLVSVVAGLCVPLTAYAFCFYRAIHPALIQWPTLDPSVHGFFRHITGAEYRSYLFGFNPSPLQRLLLAYAVYPVLGLGLAALAWWTLTAGKDTRPFAWALAAAILLNLAYAFNYAVPDPSFYFLAPMLLVQVPLVWLAVGLMERGRSTALVKKWRISVTFAILLPLACYWTFIANRRRVSVNEFEVTVHRMWQSIPYREGFVFWPDDMWYRLREYQVFRGEKPGLTVMNVSHLTSSIGRERFQRKFGFDPLPSLSLEILESASTSSALVGSSGSITAQYAALIHENINAHTPLPVVIFDPIRQSVRQLRKPATHNP